MYSVSFDGQRIQGSTKISIPIPSENWDFENHSVKKNCKDSNYNNTNLNDFRTKIEKYYHSLNASDEIITKEKIKERINEFFNP